MTSTRNNATQNGAQAGPVQFAWNSIHPPLEPFAAGLEAVAPSMPPLPPLSRSSSRTSSSTLHSFPATPCLPGNMLPHVSTVNYAEQGHFQASNGGYSTSPLHMPGSGMVCHPEVVATPALGHQPSQMYNPAGAFSVSQSHLSQERNFTGAGFVPPQFYSLHESTSTSCYYAPTQPIYNPQQYPTAATSGGIEVPTATNLPELPGSFQFTFIAQPQLQMPDSSYVGPVPDEHHFHPSLNELSQFHSGPLPVLGTDSHHSMPTFVNNDPNDNLDPTVQQEQSTTPTTGLVMGSTITECPTLNALVDGSSTVDDSWVDDILAEWASMSPPDSGLQTQTAGLPDVAPTAAPASAPVARRKRTKDESEGGAIEAAETSQPTDQKKRKKKSYKPLTSRRSGVSRVNFLKKKI